MEMSELPYLFSYKTGFCPSRMTSNYLISPVKFCNNTNFALPKHSQRSRSILQDGSRSLGLFWKEKTLSYNRRNTVPFLDIYPFTLAFSETDTKIIHF